MSSPRRTPPPDLWRRLAFLRDAELCRADWQRHTAAAFPFLEPFLEELRGAPAASIPDPETGLPLVPRRADDGTFAAYPADPDATLVAPLENLSPASVARHRLAWEPLCNTIATAFEADPQFSRGAAETPWACSLGIRSAGSTGLQLLLLLTGDSTEALRWLERHVLDDPLCIVLPGHDPLVEGLASRHGHIYRSLDRDLRMLATGHRWRIVHAAPFPSPPTRRGPAPSSKPVVVFSNSFLTVNCALWPQAEMRKRKRQADQILRVLFENWRDRGNKPLRTDEILQGVSIERLDKAMASSKYQRTWLLIDRHTDEQTGITTVWLSSDYDYESR